VTLLIDPPNAPGHGRLWSHLASDRSFEELHAFAASLGIPRRGFDRDHYDIPAERYQAVLEAGAVPVSSRELVRRLHAAGLRRRKGTGPGPGLPGPRLPGQELLRPAPLAAGDTVAVVAPAGPAPLDRLEAGLEVLRSWGLEVREGAHVRSRHRDLSYLAATDDDRAGELQEAWRDPSVRAVFCARGGYGVQRLVDRLDWPGLARCGVKALVGFSDVTALHQAFARHLGVATVHGPVVTSLGDADADTREHLRRLLCEPGEVETLFPSPLATLLPGHTAGRATGPLVGGNVTVLAAGIGSAAVMPAAGSIALLEDVAESPYRLDRALTQLLRAGWFDGVRGVVAGQFARCGDPEAVRRVLADRLGPLDVPTLIEAPVGHVEHNRAVPLGVPVLLDADAGTVTPVRRPGA
jgi:muramoyltetrapeptide carboxypeptidase